MNKSATADKLLGKKITQIYYASENCPVPRKTFSSW